MHKSFFAALLVCALGVAAATGAAPPAGEVLLITGSGTATNPADASIRSLAKGDPVYPGEILSSATNSYINVKFSDGGYVLLRPNSRFTVERYVDAAAVKTAAAPAAKPTPAPAAAAPAGTAVAQPSAQGSWGVAIESYLDPADAEGVAARTRKRGLDAEVVAVQIRKDTVWHRVLIVGLADRPAAEATVEDLKRRGYRAPFVVAGVETAAPASVAPETTAPTVAAQPEPPLSTPTPAPTPVPLSPAIVVEAQPELPPGRSIANFRLLKGGFRAVSGLIGRSDPSEYRVNTPVATIGIRGTDYLVILCDATCAQDPVFDGTLPLGSTAEGGVIVGVVKGGVFVVNDNGQQAEVGEGQYLVTLPDGTQIYLPFEPRFLKVDPIPDPVEMCE